MTDTTQATTAVAERAPHPFVVLRNQLEVRKPELANALPAYISADKFIRNAMTAVQLNPDLVTVNRASLITALMRCAQDGLFPDNRQAVILPYRDNNDRSPTKGQLIAQYQPMVAGLLLRFRNSGQFKAITAEVVREGETFRHWIDEHGEHLLHEPGDGIGKVTKAYAMALLKDGGTMIKVMSTADIEKRRAVSKSRNSPLWSTWWEEAAQKTVLRNLHKRLPTSSDRDFEELMRHDDDDDAFEPAAPSLAERPARAAGIASALDRFGGESAVAGAAATGETDIESTSTPSSSTTVEDQAETIVVTPELATSLLDQSKTPIEIAHERGSKDRTEGIQRRAVPPEYRVAERKPEADAWLAGWDDTYKGGDKGSDKGE